MSTLFGKPWTATRATVSYDADGIVTTGTPAVVYFTGTVQPADQNTIKAMAQGRENNGAIMVFSDVRLVVSMQESTQSGDIISFGGLEYELMAEQIFDNALIPHFKYLAFARGVS